MVNEHDTILVRELTDSYRGQLERYCDLRDVTRRLMGKLVLSRGDFSQVAESLREKQGLLEAIECERGRVAALVEQWQQRKSLIARNEETDLFNEVLQKVTDAIREFLEDEAQVRHYLESSLARTVSPSAPS